MISVFISMFAVGGLVRALWKEDKGLFLFSWGLLTGEAIRAVLRLLGLSF